MSDHEALAREVCRALMLEVTPLSLADEWRAVQIVSAAFQRAVAARDEFWAKLRNQCFEWEHQRAEDAIVREKAEKERADRLEEEVQRRNEECARDIDSATARGYNENSEQSPLDWALSTLDRLEAENKRLREALKT